MDFNEYILELETLIKENANNINNDDLINNLILAIQHVGKDLNSLLEEKECEPEYDIVRNALTSLANSFLTSSLYVGFSSLITKFTELVYNWNKNCHQDKTIEIICVLLSRLEETRIAMLIGIDNMKFINARHKDLAEWTPPIFELANEYFEELLVQNDMKKDN